MRHSVLQEIQEILSSRGYKHLAKIVAGVESGTDSKILLNSKGKFSIILNRRLTRTKISYPGDTQDTFKDLNAQLVSVRKKLEDKYKPFKKLTKGHLNYIDVRSSAFVAILTYQSRKPVKDEIVDYVRSLGFKLLKM